MNLPGAMDFVVKYQNENHNPAFHYHGIFHTLDVHQSAVRLAAMEEVDPEDLPLLEAAALFHDIGIMEDYKDHERKSADIARTVLPGFGFSGGSIDRICDLILSTSIHSLPTKLPEMILCDADLDHLGRADFFMRSFQLQTEWSMLGIRRTTPAEWLMIEADFMKKHRYFTQTAKATRDAGKAENLAYIERFLSSGGS